MVSALCRRPIRPHLAMTGEISLQGKVLPVGSLKEKALAAIRAHLQEVVVPKLNDRELQELNAIVSITSAQAAGAMAGWRMF